jgi:hypothetical protein
MNFQAVNVGQKLIEKTIANPKGGYKDATGTVTDNLKTEIVFVDDAIGQMVAEMQKQGLLQTHSSSSLPSTANPPSIRTDSRKSVRGSPPIQPP